jgi:hypothetical protein
MLEPLRLELSVDELTLLRDHLGVADTAQPQTTRQPGPRTGRRLPPRACRAAGLMNVLPGGGVQLSSSYSRLIRLQVVQRARDTRPLASAAPAVQPVRSTLAMLRAARPSSVLMKWRGVAASEFERYLRLYGPSVRAQADELRDIAVALDKAALENKKYRASIVKLRADMARAQAQIEGLSRRCRRRGQSGRGSHR